MFDATYDQKRAFPGNRRPNGGLDAMSTAEKKTHWDNVYATKREAEVSWFQELPSPSLELIELVAATRHSAIVDIGGGASRLVDALVSEGYEQLTVLDISATALDAAKALRYDSVVKFLVDKGAKSGRPSRQEASREP